MADRETTVTNAYESTLAAELSAVAGVADLTDVTGLTPPFYMVIEPEDAAQREYVYVTALNGSQATLDERYLGGSAAGSGLVHPSGSVVRHAFVAQHLTDINDRVDAQGDHSNLTNVTADQHHTEDHAARHLPGGADDLALEVDGSVEVDGPIDGASLTDIATVTLTIPADWNSWKCEAHATFVFAYSSSLVVQHLIQIDGVNQQTQERTTRFVGPTRDLDPAAVGGRRTGLVSTGAVDIKLLSHINSGDPANNHWKDIYLYARAVRTS